MSQLNWIWDNAWRQVFPVVVRDKVLFLHNLTSVFKNQSAMTTLNWNRNLRNLRMFHVFIWLYVEVLVFETIGKFSTLNISQTLLMLQLLRPVFQNLPCLFSTFHIEYPSVLSLVCLWRNSFNRFPATTKAPPLVEMLFQLQF